MYTDAWFAYGHHKTVEYLTRHGVIVFQYLFAYEGLYDKSYFSNVTHYLITRKSFAP